MNTPVQWVAELAQVREVSLLGTADLAFWKDRLMRQNLLPDEFDGQARLVIIAADSKYRGIRFRELSFSVFVAGHGTGAGQEAVYLIQAFNSSRLLAFCERTFFVTPYEHGDVRVSTSLPASFQLAKHGEVVFRAEMQADASAPAREPLRRGEEGWEGPILLPGNPRRKHGQGHVFFGRIHGFTQTFPFLPSKDSMTIRHSPTSNVLQALVESHFVVKEWVVREDATHARSKTYNRAELLPTVS